MTAHGKHMGTEQGGLYLSSLFPILQPMPRRRGRKKGYKGERGGGWLTRGRNGEFCVPTGLGAIGGCTVRVCLVPHPNSSTHLGWASLLPCSLPCLPGREAQGQMLWGGPESRGHSVHSLPCLALASPPWGPHLLCRRGKVLEIRGLAVSAKEKQFSQVSSRPGAPR